MVVFAMLHRTVSAVSSVHLEQFKEGNNLDKGQEQLLSASGKELNALEQSECVK